MICSATDGSPERDRDDHRWSSSAASLRAVRSARCRTYATRGGSPAGSPIPTYPIHIVVKNGRTMLLGLVDNASDRQIAELRAREVSGVFEVDNGLTLLRKQRARGALSQTQRSGTANHEGGTMVTLPREACGHARKRCSS